MNRVIFRNAMVWDGSGAAGLHYVRRLHDRRPAPPAGRFRARAAVGYEETQCAAQGHDRCRFAFGIGPS